jgi:hypothetical protein
MAEYVLYHNPDRMGYTADTVAPFLIATDKDVPDAIGSRVWLITGEGQPRTYRLVGYFIAADREEVDDPEFRWRISAPRSAGVELRRARWPILNDEPWWKEFLFRQGNFGLGFHNIPDHEHVVGLAAVLDRVRKYETRR